MEQEQCTDTPFFLYNDGQPNKTGPSGVCTSNPTPDVDLEVSKEDAAVDINPHAAHLVPSPSQVVTPVACESHEASVWFERYERWKAGSLDAHDDADLIRAAALWYAHKMASLLERGR